MSVPHIGDVLIRNLPDHGYEVVCAITRRHLAGPFPKLVDALLAARDSARRGGGIWQQTADHRGRPMGDLMRFPDAP